MKVALLHFANQYDKRTYMPLGISYLKAYAECYAYCHPEIDIINDANDIPLDCRVVGISCMSQDFDEVVEICDQLSQEGISVILGGYHISLLPETLPASVDAGVLFEGEETFTQLLDLYALHPGNPSAKEFSQIDGIVYHDGQKVVLTKIRCPIEPIDRIPHPSRNSFHLSKWQNRQPILSSRGCPFKCSFCASSVYWPKLRFFSAQYVVDEIEQLFENNPSLEGITFVDDLFTANRDRLRKIVTLLERRGLIPRIRINAGIRADTVDAELCELLAALNPNFLYFGLESASPRILKNLKDTRFSITRVEESLDLLHRYSIPVGTTFILGSPGETVNDVQETYDFVVRHLDRGTLVELAANILCPMPGTKVWKNTEKTELLSHPFRWSSLRHYSYIHTEMHDLLGIQSWFELRERESSFFLNSEMTQRELFSLMEHYDRLIKDIYSKRLLQESGVDSCLDSIIASERVLVVGDDKTAYAILHSMQRRGVTNLRAASFSPEVTRIAEFPLESIEKINIFGDVDVVVLCVKGWAEAEAFNGAQIRVVEAINRT